MNKNVTSFYVTNKSNVTIACGSNLQEFHKMFKEVYPDAKNYMYYYRKFKESKSFTIGKYHFQKLV
jgi:cell division protein YceG involved in septum cleavage